MSTEERVIEVVGDYLNRSYKDISLTDTKGSLDLDSLDWVELVMVTEEEFGVDIGDNQWDSVNTVQDIVNLVKELS